MKEKRLFIIALVIMIISIILFGINIFMSVFIDSVFRIIGTIAIIDLIVLSYSTVKLINKNNLNLSNINE